METFALNFLSKSSLQVLDLFSNEFGGEVPRKISNCQNLFNLNHFGNNLPKKFQAWKFCSGVTDLQQH